MLPLHHDPGGIPRRGMRLTRSSTMPPTTTTGLSGSFDDQGGRIRTGDLKLPKLAEFPSFPTPWPAAGESGAGGTTFFTSYIRKTQEAPRMFAPSVVSPSIVALGANISQSRSSIRARYP